MVTKAGGIITAECLSKGTPMVLLKPVPGHEAGNAAYFAREGAAVVARGTKDVEQTVSRLLADPQALKQLSDNARRLYKPGTQTVTAAVSEALS